MKWPRWLSREDPPEPPAPGSDGARGAEQQRLVEEIAAEVADTASWTGRARLSDRVARAIAEVPRHAFVTEGASGAAYENRPLPIGHGQTISQPYIVAIMTELLDLAPEHKVLEIGTGSGYQSAVLARIAREVFSVETVPELAGQAAARLRQHGFDNVHARCADGWEGWPEHAPYDRIIVTAAAARIPESLVSQLKAGGRMVVPVGPAWGNQVMTIVEKSDAGEVRETPGLPVAFVPMIEGRER